MKLKRTLSLVLATSILFVACNRRHRRRRRSTPRRRAAPDRRRLAGASRRPPASVAPSPLAADPAEAVIPNVEPDAEIHFWTFYLSPTFDDYIKATIARFEATYPGVKVNWEDHQATFQDDLNNAFAAGNAPDVINLSVSEGWVSDYASQGPAAEPRRQGPPGRQGHLLPGPLEGTADRRQELPVPVVPGPERRADQQAPVRGGRPRSGGLPEDHRRAARPVPDAQGQGDDRLRHPPHGQRPDRPDGLRGRRQADQR